MKKLFPFLLLATILFSCKVLSVPIESQTQYSLVLKVKNDIDSLYNGIINVDPAYDSHEIEYTLIGNKIDTIVSYNNVRRNAKNILSQTLILKSEFLDIKTIHQTLRNLPAGEAFSYKLYFKGLISPILESEKSLMN